MCFTKHFSISTTRRGIKTTNADYDDIHLLYMRISGFQRLEGGTRMSFTPPYSDSSHRILLSVHSCGLNLLLFKYLLLLCSNTYALLFVAVVVLYCKVNLPLSTSHFSILDWLFCRHNVDCPGTFLENETAKSFSFQVVWWGRAWIFDCVKDSFWLLHLFVNCCLLLCFWGHISATVNLTTKSFLSFSLLFTQLSDPGACFFCYTSSITSHVSYDPSITSDTSTRRTFPFSCHTLLLYCTWYVLFRACRSLLQVQPKKV